ncbi:MAG: phosphoserine phosphatase SerB [Micavibrio aeruginosavorus]|uniref:Phosphoserine phosphatase n=1 Tax=Micavibrio aeruginosavorus TaxID=349221 RepID=A0A7T5R2D0_9BACT|nr:MAG: phosphoserine phosphatase SerB [Micavibrio aeruginosavorus]
MSYYLTLIASDKQLTPGHLARIQTYLETQGVALAGAPHWLSPHHAADLPVATRPHFSQMQAMRRGLDEDRVDILVSSRESRRKTLFFADMDSTVITTETLDELAVFAGVGEQVAEITRGTMNGTIDFHEAIRRRVQMLKGLPEKVLKQVLEQTTISPGVEISLKVMRKHGVHSSLVSSGFTYYTAAIAAHCSFDDHFGNMLEIEHGRLTGRVLEPILDKTSKLEIIKTKTAEFGCDLVQTLATGDGSNDIPMMQAAGLGIAYHPRPIVAEGIDNQIVHADFTAILYAQGYTEADIHAVMN